MKSRLLSYKGDNSSKSSNFKLLEEDDQEEIKATAKNIHKSHNVFQTKLIETDEPQISQLP